MKNFGKLFLVSCLAMGLFACSKENVAPENESEISTEQLYMQFELDLPTLTRSETDDQGGSNSNAAPDQEVGTAAESAVKSIQLVLVNEANNVVAISGPDASKQNPAIDEKNGLYVVSFQSQELMAAAQPGQKTPVKVIAYVNSKAVKAEVGQPFDYNQKVTTIAAMTAAGTGFYMTNANDVDLSRCDIPAKEDLPNFDDRTRAYPIGSIEVERTAARFDLDSKNVDFTLGDAKISLAEVAMFNVPSSCYELRRVSDNGKNIAGLWAGLFGRETPTNYVVDVNADAKLADAAKAAATPELLAQYAPKTAAELNWTKVSEITTADNWAGTGDYCVWRYAVENTFPGVKAFEDVSTGVAFKTSLQAGTSASREMKAAFDAHENIYVFANVLYGSWAMVEAAATETVEQNSVNVPKNKDLNTVYEIVKAQLDESQSNLEEVAKNEGFLIYKYDSVSGIYPMYYNYYNRHNDKYGEGDGAMKHAVVRNNVYKLKVDSILRFGDPEFQQPEHKPIDQEEIFFRVTVKILPWTVRVNNIEF